MTHTTEDNATTAPDAKPPGIPSLADLDARDWFAGMAMQGMLAGTLRVMVGEEVDRTPSALATMAGNFADAMIAEREREEAASK